VLYAATVPLNAPNETLGVAFVHLLLSAGGIGLLIADGFTPITPGWCDRPSALPSVLAPEVVPFPIGVSATG
jgi:hypothetical protein